MKSSETPGSFTKNSSQRRPTGVKPAIAERDDLYLMHPSGNATALGSHTAWLRLLTKTVERAILKRPYVHVGYTSIC